MFLDFAIPSRAAKWEDVPVAGAVRRVGVAKYIRKIEVSIERLFL